MQDRRLFAFSLFPPVLSELISWASPGRVVFFRISDSGHNTRGGSKGRPRSRMKSHIHTEKKKKIQMRGDSVRILETGKEIAALRWQEANVLIISFTADVFIINLKIEFKFEPRASGYSMHWLVQFCQCRGSSRSRSPPSDRLPSRFSSRPEGLLFMKSPSSSQTETLTRLNRLHE